MSKNLAVTEGPQITSQYGAYALGAGLARLHALMRMHTHTRQGTHMHARTHAQACTHRPTCNTYNFSTATVVSRTLLSVTLHYVTLHYITLRYITLHLTFFRNCSSEQTKTASWANRFQLTLESVFEMWRIHFTVSRLRLILADATLFLPAFRCNRRPIWSFLEFPAFAEIESHWCCQTRVYIQGGYLLSAIIRTAKCLSYFGFDDCGLWCEAVRSVARFLGPFNKLRKATVSFVMSVRRLEQLGSHWTDFGETWYLNSFRKNVE
jgi:hypothetical protein